LPFGCNYVQTFTQTYNGYLYANWLHKFIEPYRRYVKYVQIFTEIYIRYLYAKYTTATADVNICQYGTVQ